MFSPLEQFSINKLLSINLAFFDFSITNSTILTLLSCSLAIFVYNSACYKAILIPHESQTLFEYLYEFIYFTVLTENVKKMGHIFFQCCLVFFHLFFFVIY